MELSVDWPWCCPAIDRGDVVLSVALLVEKCCLDVGLCWCLHLQYRLLWVLYLDCFVHTSCDLEQFVCGSFVASIESTTGPSSPLFVTLASDAMAIDNDMPSSVHGRL